MAPKTWICRGGFTPNRSALPKSRRPAAPLGSPGGLSLVSPGFTEPRFASSQGEGTVALVPHRSEARRPRTPQPTPLPLRGGLNATKLEGGWGSSGQDRPALRLPTPMSSSRDPIAPSLTPSHARICPYGLIYARAGSYMLVQARICSYRLVYARTGSYMLVQARTVRKK